MGEGNRVVPAGVAWLTDPTKAGSRREPTETHHFAMTYAPQQINPLADTHVDNGILGRVPSPYVGQAQMSLPDPASVPDDEISVEVEAGWLGRVRLTFRKYRYTRPKGKLSAVAWSCRFAERISPGVQAS